MARSTKAEIAARIEELVPLILDGLRAREIRIWAAAKTTWGSQISQAQLKRYLAMARRQISRSAQIDHPHEIAVAKLRYERALARAAAKGDSKACIAANRGLCELLGLNAPARLEHSVEIDIVAARRTLEAEIAQAIAEAEADAHS